MYIKDHLELEKKNRRRFPIPVFAFFASFFATVLMFAIYGYAPFGPSAIWISDLKVQYAPFLTLLRSNILEGNLNSYSFQYGLGKNAWGIFAYYLSSPFNLLTLLFPASHVSQAITIIILLKMSFAGSFMAHFLCERRQDSSKWSVVFSLLYVFSAYALVYSFNLMWMDGFLLLPLLLACIERYLRKPRRWKALVVVLSLMFLSGYYIAYMAGIFSFIYLIARRIEGKWIPNSSEDPSVDIHNKFSESTIKSATRYVGCALLAAMISAAVLLPAGLDTIGNKDVVDSAPGRAVRFSPLAIFDQIFMGSYRDLSANMPLIYCGIICILLLILYFLHPKISRKSKYVSMSVLIFFFLSFQISALDSVWHLFDSPNWFTYRYAFVAVIFIIGLAYDTFMTRIALRGKHFRIAGFIFLGIIVISSTIGSFRTEGVLFYINLLIGMILLILIWADTLQDWHASVIGIRKYAVFALVSIVVIEVTILAPLTIRVEALGKSKILVSEYASDYLAIRELYDQAEKVTDADTFYRMDTFMQKDHSECSFSTINSGALFGHSGTSAFYSMSNKSAFRFMKQLGADVNYNFFYAKQNYSTGLIDSFFGMRYLISDRAAFTDAVSAYENRSMGFSMYENQYAFPLMFVVDENAMNFDFYQLEKEGSDNNPFEFQNAWFDSLIGDNSSSQTNSSAIYYPAKATGPNSYNAIESKEFSPKEQKASFSFNRSDFQALDIEKETRVNYLRISDNDIMALEYLVEVESSDILYMQAACPRVSPDIIIFVNDKEIMQTSDSYYPKILCLGRFNAGETIRVRIQGQRDTDIFNFSEVYFYHADPEAFIDRSESLRSLMTPDTIRVQDGDIRATLNGYEGMIYISTIPYEKGWTLTIDGEKAPIRDYQSAFIAFDLPEGTHEVHLSFRAPGLRQGAVLSACGILGFILLAVFSEIRKSKSDSRK